jgi:hypothetical protein
MTISLAFPSKYGDFGALLLAQEKLLFVKGFFLKNFSL